MDNSNVTGRMIALLRSLLQATLAGNLQWEATDRQATFLTSRPQGSATIRSIDGDGGPPFELSLLNPDGEVIERLQESRRDFSEWDADLLSLYTAARRSALNIDKTIDAWIEDVKGLEEEEPPF